VDGGRLAVISFHSGEDAEVKRFFSQGASEGRWEVLTRKPVTASREELLRNRRSRSALLRVGARTRRAQPVRGGGA
ncbi:MAG: 16S rRNA (cytosine(1402)-N(4))-methyltransferase, partial [Planctomycetota bacterium]